MNNFPILHLEFLNFSWTSLLQDSDTLWAAKRIRCLAWWICSSLCVWRLELWTTHSSRPGMRWRQTLILRLRHDSALKRSPVPELDQWTYLWLQSAALGSQSHYRRQVSTCMWIWLEICWVVHLWRLRCGWLHVCSIVVQSWQRHGHPTINFQGLNSCCFNYYKKKIVMKALFSSTQQAV